MITLIIPSYGGGPNIERTIASVEGICDEVVIVSTALYDADKEHFNRIADAVVELPWNYTFLHGFASVSNHGAAAATNDWLMLFGVGETFAEALMPVHSTLAHSARNKVFRCNHVNDPYTWKRVWHRHGGAFWSGIIHEEIIRGVDGGLLFRMQDTDKTPRADPLEQEVLKWIKGLSYNHLYHELLLHPDRLGGASPNWLKFVQGAREFIEAFCADHADMLEPCLAGDRDGFIAAVAKRSASSAPEALVSFHPQGT